MPENISGVPAGRSVFHLTSPLQELGQQLLSNQQPGLAKFLAPVTPPLAQSTALIGLLARNSSPASRPPNQDKLNTTTPRRDLPFTHLGDCARVVDSGELGSPCCGRNLFWHCEAADSN